MPFQPRVSIIINTDGRAGPLATCLESLRYLRYPNFEVVVVVGPTQDGTRELCAAWGDAIKFGECPARNLSQSRNISIGLATGEIVAFLDDDSVPEPEWLDDVIPAFEDPEVAVAGGFLHDHTGKAYQWRFGTADRLGTADQGWTRPAPEFNFPQSHSVPHVMANSAFRRTALLDVGGFDEEYEYYLDETDVICRFVDAGWKVAQLDKGFIHHKYMPSHIRNVSGMLTSWYSVVKNKMYFGLRNGQNHMSVQAIVANVQHWIADYRIHVHAAIAKKKLAESDAQRYDDEAERGFRDGLAHGLNGERRLAPIESLRGDIAPFVLFSPKLPAAQQRCYILLTQTYPPGSIGGIGRYIHQLARTLAARGHQVHVLTTGADHDRVDFEENVWVHRIVVKNHALPTQDDLRGVPHNIWNYSRTLLDEAREIAARREVDAVYAPIWDAEGIAFLDAPELPLVTSLQTTMRFYLDSNPHLRNDASFMSGFAEPMLRMEKLLLQRSAGIHAISRAIAQEIETGYGISFEAHRLWTVPLGLEDWTSAAGASKADDRVRVCFVGRLESRKGVDVVMDIAPGLLQAHPNVVLEFVGNDRVLAGDGRPWRARFEERPEFAAVKDRIVFRGEVSEEALRDAYRTADIILAPSRFESFGLVHLEAGMYGKPVIGGAIGGMLEVVDNGVTGILVQPGDAKTLREALDRLIEDAQLRVRMGRAARERYLALFTPDRMADGVIAMFTELASRHPRVAVDSATAPAPILAVREERMPGGPRIAVIGSVLSPYDAISNDLVRTVQYLREIPGCEVSVFAGHNERSDVPAKVVTEVSNLLLEPGYRNADVIVWHFGIYYPIFDGILLGNGRAKQAVIFHNITPLALVPPASRRTIEKSFEQLQHLQFADAIWPVSRENLEMLVENGIDAARITVQPLAVDRPARQGLSGKRSTGTIDILFIGRIVPAKGIQDLVEALAYVEAKDIRVKVIGSLEAAPADFRETLLARIDTLGLSSTIEFAGAVSDDERDMLLAASHILVVPSYHEGFCVPVIEALRAGAIPVVYSAHNLRYIADGLCISAPPGDIAALARAITRAVDDVRAVLAKPESAKLHLDRGGMTAAEFERAASTHVDAFEPRVAGESLRRLARLLLPPAP